MSKSKITSRLIIEELYSKWTGYNFKLVSRPAHTTKIKVICDEHGESDYNYCRSKFPSSPCIKCRVNHNKLSHQQYVTKCNKKFGSKYKYLTEYQSGDYGVISYICPKHGVQEMNCKSHFRSPTGCVECTKDSTDYARSKGCFSWKLLAKNEELANEKYLVYVGYSDNYQKVGITKDNGCGIQKRASELKRSSGVHYCKIIFSGTLEECFELEQLILEETDSITPVNKFGGHTECFCSDFLYRMEGIV